MRHDITRDNFNTIVSYVADAVGVDSLQGCSFEAIFDSMRGGDHPQGYLRCLAIYSFDAEVSNGGFKQLFGNGYEELVPYAVAGFSRIGEEPIAGVLEEALALWQERSSELEEYPQQSGEEEFMSLTDLMSRLEEASKEGWSLYPKGSLLHRLSEIDDRYWDLRTELQGGEAGYEYLLAPINRYYQEFPNDF